MVSLKQILALALDEIRLAIKEYMLEAETAVKRRIKKMLLYGIAIGVLVALVIAFLGSAALFILIGSLRYLQTTMPTWAAWYTIGITSAIVGIVMILVVYLIIRKQLKSNQPTEQI